MKELNESVSRVHHLKTSSSDAKEVLTEAVGKHDSFAVFNNKKACHNKTTKQNNAGINALKRPIEKTNENVAIKRQKVAKTGKAGKSPKSKLRSNKSTKTSKKVGI